MVVWLALMQGMNGDGEPLQDRETASLDGLNECWEADPIIRGHALRNEGTLLCWPSKELTGVVSFQTIACNARVLWQLLETWCPQVPEPKTVSMAQVRQQAGAHVYAI